MNADMVAKLLDACFLAKKVSETMPPLPDGMVGRHVHIIDAIVQTGKNKDKVYVSDVSAQLRCTTPSITRLIGELESLGYLSKRSDPDDKRHVFLILSEKGRRFHAAHVTTFHAMLASALDTLDVADCLAAIEVIQTLHDKIRSVTDSFTRKVQEHEHHHLR